MAKEKTLGLSIKKADNLAEWYPELVLKSELAEYSAVKGCMVYRPTAMSIWETIQNYFNPVIRKLGVKNAYFPLFIPESFFKKEAEHAEGFTPEVAWIEAEPGEERLAVRPTSETIMCDSFARWVRSWRDLPLRINQWCNVVRWETKQTRLFLRGREFLWQEGHCLYATEAEADKEVALFMDEYVKLVETHLAIPVIVGKKTRKETFAGAKYSLTMEALMPDGKSLQCGTSHNLGQGFVKAFNITFLDKDEQTKHPFHTSWGISTRLIGAVAMTHSDDKGLVLPPKVAPNKVVIVPIIFEDSREKVMAVASQLADALSAHEPILDDRDGYSPGWKYNEWELKGVPLRVEIGPKDVEKQQCVIVRRDTGEKAFVPLANAHDAVDKMLTEMQQALFDKAKAFLDANIVEVKDWKDFLKQTAARKLVLADFCGEPSCEEKIKDKTEGVTSRCIASDKKHGTVCVQCGEPAKMSVYFAKAY